MIRPLRNVNRAPLAALACLVALPAGLCGQVSQAAGLRVSQLRVVGPEVRAYVYALTPNGEPVSGITASQISATVGAVPARVVSVAPFGAAKEGVAYIFLVDVSRSVTARQFATMQSELQKWVAQMGSADRAAVMSFGDNVRVLQDYSSDRKALGAAIGALAPRDNKTQLYGAIAAATALGRRRDPSLPFRRIVVLLSDGIDDAMRAMTKEELVDMIRGEPIPVYALAFTSPPYTRQKRAGLATLGELARRSGGLYVGPQDIAQALKRARDLIDVAQIVYIQCKDCPVDGALHRVEITLSAANAVSSDGMEARFLPIPRQPTNSLPWWLPVLFTASLGAVGSGAYLLLKHPTAPLPEPVREPEPVAEEVRSLPARSVPQQSSPVARAHPSPPVGGIDLQLALVSSPGDAAKSRVVHIVDRAVIGRSSAADVSFPNDPAMSEEHCEMLRESGVVILRDLNSSNGTYINGVKVRTAYKLEDGDLLGIGQTQLRIEFARQVGHQR